MDGNRVVTNEAAIVKSAVKLYQLLHITQFTVTCTLRRPCGCHAGRCSSAAFRSQRRHHHRGRPQSHSWLLHKHRKVIVGQTVRWPWNALRQGQHREGVVLDLAVLRARRSVVVVRLLIRVAVIPSRPGYPTCRRTGTRAVRSHRGDIAWYVVNTPIKAHCHFQSIGI